MTNKYGFLARASREEGRSAGPRTSSEVGPGSYSPPPTFQASKPGFVPFATSSERQHTAKSSNVPKPGVGQYNIQEQNGRASTVSSFKSHTQRFQRDPTADVPGPGQYNIAGGLIAPAVAKVPDKSTKKIAINWMLIPSVPSVPVKHQSYGYEMGASGELIMQQPRDAGFTGRGKDTVGPADYNPNFELRFSSAGAGRVWSRFASREQAGGTQLYERVGLRNEYTPGPGHYNASIGAGAAVQDEHGGGNGVGKCMAPARKRMDPVFESKADRISTEAKAKATIPGPGYYVLPSTLDVSTKAPDMQCFNSTTSRFRDVPRSVKLHTAPGMYSSPLSDFDKARLKTLRHKLLTQRSPWATSIGFGGTDYRFSQRDVNAQRSTPAPGVYERNDGIGDHVQRKSRVSSFGTTAKRFHDARTAEAAQKREEALALQTIQRPSTDPERAVERKVSRALSSFVSAQKRFNHDAHEQLAPPPGAYDTRPRWEPKGAVKYSLPIRDEVRIQRLFDDVELPGPGSYNLGGMSSVGTSLQSNRRNVMISQSERFPNTEEKSAVLPGPGWYDACLPDQGWIKPTHNILIAEQSQG